MNKSNPYRKPEDAWKITKKGVKLTYPIFHHDPAIPDDPTIKMTVEEVIGDIDFWGWEGNSEDRIIDSTGKVFIAKFEKSKGHTYLIIPTKFHSGIFPGEVEKVMSVEEIREIMVSGIKRNEARIEENKEKLLKEIQSMSSIREILLKCKSYF